MPKKNKRKPRKKTKQKGGNGMCSPALPSSAGTSATNDYNYSCFNLKDLKKMAKDVNKKFGSDIKVNQYKATDKAKLMRDIHRSLKCGNMSLDTCIVKKYEGDFDKTIKKNFKPKGPNGKNEWLSSVDIYDVMEQYMIKYPEFLFFGPVPIDFSDLSNAISRIQLKKLKNKKSKIGIVFNTDPSYKSGEHWISMFIDLKNGTICFFDSVGDEPPKEVKKLMNKLIKQARSIGIKLKPIVNDTQHQRGNNECGVYSLYFIISRLMGKSCDYLNKKVVHDKEMNTYRKKFFRPPT